MAVATFESVCLIPHFARIDVTPAKKAEPNAYKIHMIIFLLIYASKKLLLLGFPSAFRRQYKMVLIKRKKPLIPHLTKFF